jgi:hypothetical protein
MKKKILGGIAILAIAAVAAFNVNLNTQESNMSPLALANVEALAGSEYHLGQPGTNWKKYTISCTAAQQNSTGSSWYWDVNAQAYVYEIPVGAGAGGGGSSSSQINYAPMTYDKDVCGAGSGTCFSSVPSGHPCA